HGAWGMGNWLFAPTFKGVIESYELSNYHCNSSVAQLPRTGKMPVPQRVNFLVEQAGKPVHKQLIENGVTYEL
ncbi:hypothetical protein, partial [Tychonema bourrellyi]